MNLFCFHSDKFQEYKKKHLERKAAVVKELGLKLPNEPFVSETAKGQKSSAKETGRGKEAEDGGSPAVERKSQQEQSLKEVSVERAAVVSASDHVVQPAEQIQHKEKTDVERQHSEDSEKAASDTEMKIVNGESEVRAAGQETETTVQNGVKSSTDNGEMKSVAKCDEMKSDEKNCEVNGSGVPTAKASVLKSKGTWADVVSKAFIANGTAHKDPAVNGVAHVSANGTAHE